MDISIEKAKELLETGVSQAQEMLKEPSKVDGVLAQLEDKLREVPAIGETLSDLPLMVSMVKSYITREYTNVSPKVIATMLGAFVYMVKKKDLIPDKIPIIGIADDLAVLGLALKLSETELKAFKSFRDGAEGQVQEIREAQEVQEPQDAQDVQDIQEAQDVLEV